MVMAKFTKSIVRSHQFAQSQYAELGVTGNCAGLILFVALSLGALTKTLAVHRAWECKDSSVKARYAAKARRTGSRWSVAESAASAAARRPPPTIRGCWRPSKTGH